MTPGVSGSGESNDVYGAILAGGRSRRMGGDHKALLRLGGTVLLRHVIERLAPQVGGMCLSVEAAHSRFEPLGLRQVADPARGSNGPLGGLLSVLASLPAAFDWVLVAPCDGPFLPADLGSRLLQGASRAGRLGAVARYEGELQPTFSLWHRDLLPAIRDAVMVGGLPGFKPFLVTCPLPAVDWPEGEPPPFYNVNRPSDLKRAAEWLAESAPGHPG